MCSVNFGWYVNFNEFLSELPTLSFCSHILCFTLLEIFMVVLFKLLLSLNEIVLKVINLLVEYHFHFYFYFYF